MPNRLRWDQDSDRHWNVWMGSERVCEVTCSGQFVVSSPDHTIEGGHSSLEGAVAQVQAWVRWSGV
ncbi:hypothetical protein [Curtobacterium sp. 9128]|uniref:hypothetical protein n=1 Tax=Curtobacterium sp. 9128 TaxID=1793722 RepID=UPI0011A33337|nr:hypothetical protein [Curtobacterium sp. 9128]